MSLQRECRMWTREPGGVVRVEMDFSVLTN
jgi:hypothetical protein